MRIDQTDGARTWLPLCMTDALHEKSLKHALTSGIQIAEVTSGNASKPSNLKRCLCGLGQHCSGRPPPCVKVELSREGWDCLLHAPLVAKATLTSSGPAT